MRIYWYNTFYHPLLMIYTSLYTVTCPETEEPAECPPEEEEEDPLCQGEGAMGSDAGCPPNMMCCNVGCNFLDCVGKWKKLTGKEFFSFQDHFSNAEVLINPSFLWEHFCLLFSPLSRFMFQFTTYKQGLRSLPTGLFMNSMSKCGNSQCKFCGISMVLGVWGDLYMVN